MKRKNIFLYLFIVIVIAKIALLFLVRQSSVQLIEMNRKYEGIKKDVHEFKSFGDSLAAATKLLEIKYQTQFQLQLSLDNSGKISGKTFK